MKRNSMLTPLEGTADMSSARKKRHNTADASIPNSWALAPGMAQSRAHDPSASITLDRARPGGVRR